MQKTDHNITWEHHQDELWERIFQVTQDVASVAQTVASAGHAVVSTELTKTAMSIGTELVRANAADNAAEFRACLKEARLRAIETDYWLRMAFVLQQQSNLQQDLSGIIVQYAAIIEMLEKFSRHASSEKNVLGKHAGRMGPRVA